ncbi:MAG: hypothetical protein IJ449_03675 [Clostridia bacterium]|nr:hypothetical protein [Clostridia bacterium]
MILGNLAIFAGGVLFGTAGIRLLGSKDAKKVYAHTAAAALRVKDTVMTTVTNIRENADDIMADAKAINDARAVQEEIVEDCSGDTCSEEKNDEE